MQHVHTVGLYEATVSEWMSGKWKMSIHDCSKQFSRDNSDFIDSLGGQKILYAKIQHRFMLS